MIIWLYQIILINEDERDWHSLSLRAVHWMTPLSLDDVRGPSQCSWCWSLSHCHAVSFVHFADSLDVVDRDGDCSGDHWNDSAGFGMVDAGDWIDRFGIWTFERELI